MEILDLGRVISWILWVFPKQQSYLLTNFFTNSKSILEKWGDNEFNEYFGENDLIVVSILISQFINSV